MTGLYCKISNGEIAGNPVIKPRSAEYVIMEEVEGEVVAKGVGITFGANANDDEYREHGYYPVVDDAQTWSEHYQRVADYLYEIDSENQNVIRVKIIEEIPLAERKAAMRAQLKATRRIKEEGGITLNGARIATDRESQAMITGALKAFDADILNGEIDFKGEPDENGNDTWISIDSATCLALATAVANHVQQCFSYERMLSEMIAGAETHEDLNEIDLENNWPGE
jgi:hypothetical protein